MANEGRASLIIELKDFVSQGLGKIGDKLQGLASQLEKSKFIFAGTFAALVGGIGLSLKAFGEEELAINSLTQALLNQGISNKAVIDDLRKYAAELQKVSNYQDDQIISAQTQLVQFGLTGEKLKEVTKATIDLASAKGIDLISAAQLVGKAFVGETAMLSRYGIVVDENLSKTGKFDEALKIISGTMGGQAFAQTQTLTGSVNQLKMAFNDFQEEIGSIFSPIIKQVSGFLTDLIRQFQNLSPITKSSIVIFAALGLAFSGLLTAAAGIAFIMPVLISTFGVILGPIGLATAGIIGLAAVVFALRGSFEELDRVSSETAAGLGRSWSGFAEAFSLLMSGQIAAGWQRFKDAAADAVIAVGEGINQVTRTVADNAEQQFNSLTDLVSRNKTAYDKDVANQQAAANKKRVQDQKEKEFVKQQHDKHQMDITAIDQRELKRRIDFENWQYEEKMKGAEAFKQFMIGAVTSQNAVIRTIGKVFQIQETIGNTQRAAMGAYAALAGIPFVGPILGAAAAAAAIAYGAERVSTIAAMAQGGLVLPTQGGTIARIGEAGSKEAVIPLNDSEATREIREAIGGDGLTININAGVLVADKESVRMFAKEIDRELYELKKTKQSVAF